MYSLEKPISTKKLRVIKVLTAADFPVGLALIKNTHTKKRWDA